MKKFFGNAVIHTGKDENQLQELQKDFMRQNDHLKGRRKCSSIHIELTYKRGKNNPRITDKAMGRKLIALQQNQILFKQTLPEKYWFAGY